jgi:hypothetical protein
MRHRLPAEQRRYRLRGVQLRKLHILCLPERLLDLRAGVQSGPQRPVLHRLQRKQLPQLQRSQPLQPVHRRLHAEPGDLLQLLDPAVHPVQQQQRLRDLCDVLQPRSWRPHLRAVPHRRVRHLLGPQLLLRLQHQLLRQQHRHLRGLRHQPVRCLRLQQRLPDLQPRLHPVGQQGDLLKLQRGVLHHLLGERRRVRQLRQRVQSQHWRRHQLRPLLGGQLRELQRQQRVRRLLLRILPRLSHPLHQLPGQQLQHMHRHRRLQLLPPRLRAHRRQLPALPGQQLRGLRRQRQHLHRLPDQLHLPVRPVCLLRHFGLRELFLNRRVRPVQQRDDVL